MAIEKVRFKFSLKKFHLFMFNCLFLTFCLSCQLTQQSTLYYKPKKFPVILVPGDGGSQLQAKLDKPSVVHWLCTKKTKDFIPLWLNLEYFPPIKVDCLADNLRLVYNNKTRTTTNSPGVQIRVPGFGNTSSVEWLDASQLSVTSYFREIVTTLVTKLNYTRGVNVRGAPYDFRKAPNELADYYKALQNLIEETYAKNGNTPCVIVAHSLGNMNTLYFLQHMSSSWKRKYVKSYVAIAGPFAGAIKIMKVLSTGDNLGVFVVDTKAARREQRTMPSSAFMMPSPKFWKEDEVLIYTNTFNYTVKDYLKFFKDIEFMDGWEMRQDTKNILNPFLPPGVDTYCVHGKNVLTPGSLVFGPGKFPDGTPSINPDDGDGTVNMRSLLACTMWQGKQKQRFDHKVINGAEHMGILQSVDLLNYLIDVLKSG